MTNQPEWEFICNLGDASPLEYGGMFLYRDKTGTYSPELERCEPLENGKFEIRRVCLDRYKQVDGYLVPFKYEKDWNHPVHMYEPWFKESLNQYDGIVENLCSDDPKQLASAYMSIYDYHGWDNGDEYPLILTRDEVEKRYKEELQ